MDESLLHTLMLSVHPLSICSYFYFSIQPASRPKFPVTDVAIYNIYRAPALMNSSQSELFPVSSSKSGELLVKTTHLNESQKEKNWAKSTRKKFDRWTKM